MEYNSNIFKSSAFSYNDEVIYNLKSEIKIEMYTCIKLNIWNMWTFAGMEHFLMETDCKRAVSKPSCWDLQFCVVFFHAEIRRNETLKNLSRETVKRASVHEMLFSFCATYSPELPLSFSMKPVPRAPCLPPSDTHTLAALPCNPRCVMD